MRDAVIITKSNQRKKLQMKITSRRTLKRTVFNLYGVAAVEHEQRLLQLHALHFKSEDGKWVEPETGEIFISQRMNHTGIFIGGEINSFLADDQCLFQLGKQQHASAGGMQRRSKQAVI